MSFEKVPSNKDIWDSIASSFDTTRKKPWHQIQKFLRDMEPNSVLIDIGCGNGRHLVEAIDKNTIVIGLDISRNLLTISRGNIPLEKRKKLHLIQGTATHLPLNNNSCDLALYIATLHTIRTRKERMQSLFDLYRILKPGNMALISVWAREQDRFKDHFKKDERATTNLEKGDIIIYWRQHKLNIPRFYHLYTKEEFTEDIQETGFQIIDLEDAKLTSNDSVDNYFATVRKP